MLSPLSPHARDRPAVAANIARNRRAERLRARRWRAARDALWRLVSPHIEPGATVAVVGAGNAHDLPLTRLLERASRVDLIDLDGDAARRALRRERRALRRRAVVAARDVTAGAADRIVRSAVTGQFPRAPLAPARPLAGRYDVVIGDLFYSQLLYPGLLDAGLDAGRIHATLGRYGQPLTDSVVRRLHASAPGGLVVHVHDLLGWWQGHTQPFSLRDALADAHDPAALQALAARGRQPLGCDPFAAAGCARVVARAAWHWPFADGTDYLVTATIVHA